MKTILTILLLMTSLHALSSKVVATNRKVSNSHYSVCHLEREGKDQKNFKRDYHFPFPMTKDEVYEIKGSLRWNSFQIKIQSSGKVEIHIKELIKGEMISVVKQQDLGPEPHFASLKSKVELKKDDTVVQYNVQCTPE